MKKLRYGIMSASSIAPRFIGAVRQSGCGEVVAISSRSEEKARQKADEWSIPKAYGSHVQLLEDTDVDIVYISSVNSAHYQDAKDALEYGKHVICEKPCTVSVSQTKELFAIAREKKLFFMEAQKMLFLPVINLVKDHIAQGDVGQVQMIEFDHSFSAGYNGWLFDPSLGGGTLLSSGIYAIQFLLWVFGDIKSIGGVCTKNPGAAEHQYILNGEAENGVLFSVKNSTGAVLDNKAVIYGTKGKIVIPDYWKARKYIFGEKITEIPCEFELSYEAIHISDCIEKGLLTSPVVTEEISVKGIEVIERIKREWDKN